MAKKKKNRHGQHHEDLVGFSGYITPELKANAADVIGFEAAIGDGWLIGAETAGYLRQGGGKVLAIQPFGCMPNHVSGRGQYAALQRKCGGQVVSIDVDASGSPVNAYNRARMLIDGAPAVAAVPQP